MNTQIDKTVGDSRAQSRRPQPQRRAPDGLVYNQDERRAGLIPTDREALGQSQWLCDQFAVRLLGFAGSTVDRERQRVERMAADMNGLVGDQRDQGGQQCRRRPLGAPSQAAQFTGLAQRIPARLTVAMRSTPNKETDP